MAIDSRDKRASTLVGLLSINVFPNPDGTIGTADRLQAGTWYSGIAADEPTANPADPWTCIAAATDSWSKTAAVSDTWTKVS